MPTPPLHVHVGCGNVVYNCVFSLFEEATAPTIDNINPERKKTVSLGLEPGSILAFQDLHATDVVTSRLPKS